MRFGMSLGTRQTVCLPRPQALLDIIACRCSRMTSSTNGRYLSLFAAHQQQRSCLHHQLCKGQVDAAVESSPGGFAVASQRAFLVRNLCSSIWVLLC